MTVTKKHKTKFAACVSQTLASCLFVVISMNCFAQNNTEPVMPTFQPISPTNGTNSGNHYYNYKPANNQSSTSTNTPDMNTLNQNWDKMTVDERNRVVMKIHNIQPPPTTEDIQQKQYEQIYNPQAFKQELSQYEKLSMELLNDAYDSESDKRVNFSYYSTPEFKAKTQSFDDAFNTINQGLSGKKSISIREAYFQMENAFGNTYLSHDEYNKTIQQNADFIKKWLTQNGYDIKNNEALNIGIQRFMKDTLSIKIINPDSKTPEQTRKHMPYRYDYVDFKAEKDHRNYYITKCLATGYGQCNSLPGVYLVLAEALGAKAYLTIAPQHSFVKYLDNKGAVHNYEPTSNYKIDDKWYQDYFHISTTAIQNGIYLDTLNKKQIIANCLQDLGFAYLTKYGIANAEFINKCVNRSMDFFPKNNNIQALFLKSETLSHMLERIMHDNKINNINNIDNIPQAKEIYTALLENEKLIRQLGYQQMPEQEYLEIMNLHENRAVEQEQNNITGKQKRNLFIQAN